MSWRVAQLRATLSDNFQYVLAAFLLLAALGGFVTYETYLSPGTEVETVTESSWDSSVEYAYSSSANESAPPPLTGETQVNDQSYLREYFQELNGNLVYSYRASDGGNLSVTVTHRRILRSDIEDNPDSVYWQVDEQINSTQAWLRPNEVLEADFTLDVSDALNELETREKQLGPTPGNKEVLIRSQISISGERNGKQVFESNKTELRITKSGSGDVYYVQDPGVIREQNQETREKTVPATYGPVRRGGAPALLLFSLVGVLGLLLGRRTDQFELSAAEREWVNYRRTAEELSEWISVGELPEEARFRTTIAVDELEDLVDIAIDSNRRVIKDDTLDLCAVLLEDAVYEFEPPDRPESSVGIELTEIDQLSPSSDAIEDAVSTLRGLLGSVGASSTDGSSDEESAQSTTTESSKEAQKTDQPFDESSLDQSDNALSANQSVDQSTADQPAADDHSILSRDSGRGDFRALRDRFARARNWATSTLSTDHSSSRQSESLRSVAGTDDTGKEADSRSVSGDGKRGSGTESSETDSSQPAPADPGGSLRSVAGVDQDRNSEGAQQPAENGQSGQVQTAENAADDFDGTVSSPPDSADTGQSVDSQPAQNSAESRPSDTDGEQSLLNSLKSNGLVSRLSAFRKGGPTTGGTTARSDSDEQEAPPIEDRITKIGSEVHSEPDTGDTDGGLREKVIDGTDDRSEPADDVVENELADTEEIIYRLPGKSAVVYESEDQERMIGNQSAGGSEVVVTDENILVVGTKQRADQIHSIPYRDVKSVSGTDGLLRSKITVEAWRDGTYTLKLSDSTDLERAVEYSREAKDCWQRVIGIVEDAKGKTTLMGKHLENGNLDQSRAARDAAMVKLEKARDYLDQASIDSPQALLEMIESAATHIQTAAVENDRTEIKNRLSRADTLIEAGKSATDSRQYEEAFDKYQMARDHLYTARQTAEAAEIPEPPAIDTKLQQVDQGIEAIERRPLALAQEAAERASAADDPEQKITVLDEALTHYRDALTVGWGTELDPDGDPDRIKNRTESVASELIETRVQLARDHESAGDSQIPESVGTALERYEQALGHLEEAHTLASEFRAGDADEIADHVGRLDTKNSPDLVKALVDKLPAVVREGREIIDREPLNLAIIADEAWRNVETPDMSLTVDSTTNLRAEKTSLLQAFENLYRILQADTVRQICVGTTESGFYVEEESTQQPRPVSTNDSPLPHGAAISYSVVEAVFAAHGWGLSLVEGEAGGIRFEVHPAETQIVTG